MASSDNFMAINSVIFLGNEDQQHWMRKQTSITVHRLSCVDICKWLIMFLSFT